MSWSIKEIQIEGIPPTEKSKISVTVKCGATTYTTSKADASTNFRWTVDYVLPSEPGELIFFHVVRCRKFLVCFKKKEVMGNSYERASDLVERVSQSGADTINVDIIPANSASGTLALTVKLVNAERAGSTSDDTGLLGSTNSGVPQLNVNIPSGGGDLLPSATQLGVFDVGKGS